MSLADMKVFNGFLYEPTYEKVSQMVDKFNQNSNGALTLAAASNVGDYEARMFWKNLGAAQYRRDAYNSGAQSPVNLAQEQWDSVKVAGGFGPVVWEPGQLSWIQRAPAEAIEVISSAVAEEIVKDQLNSVIAALVAAISNNASVTNDVSGTGAISQETINDSMALFGDSSMNIRAHIMTGVQYHKLVGQAIQNSNSLFEIGGVAVRDGSAFGQGRPIIVTDAPALREAGTPNKQKVLSLVAGAGMVEDNQDFISRIHEPINTTGNNQNLETLYQNNYTFNLRLAGYSWDRVNGGKSPSNAAIATGANWGKVVTDNKHTAGVISIGQE